MLLQSSESHINIMYYVAVCCFDIMYYELVTMFEGFASDINKQSHNLHSQTLVNFSKISWLVMRLSFMDIKAAVAGNRVYVAHAPDDSLCILPFVFSNISLHVRCSLCLQWPCQVPRWPSGLSRCRPSSFASRCTEKVK